MTDAAQRSAWHRLLASNAPRAIVLIRIAVGVVFTAEGIQKFLFPEELGAGRFAQIGIPAPDVMGPFVGVVEIVCGLLVLGGLLIRIAAIALVIDMLVAIAATKVPILLEHGWWSMLHEARTDLSMLLASAFLVVVGAGERSLDARLGERKRR